MATPIVMPQVGHDIPSAKILEWKVKEGDVVKKGDVVAIVESEKASFEVEAFDSGAIIKILHGVDAEVKVFEPIAYLGAPGEKMEDRGTTAPSAGQTPARQQVAPERSAAAAPAPAESKANAIVTPPVGHDLETGRVCASPSARRAARERGVDLSSVAGSGPGGRIVKRDVTAAFTSKRSAAPAPASPHSVSPAVTAEPGDQVIAFSKLRQGIARNLTLSKQTIPHFYLFVDVDMTHAIAWRVAFNERHGSRVTVTDMLVAAAARALREFPVMNSHVDPTKMVLKKDVNIGVAVSVEEGLLVPVVADADRKDIFEIHRIIKENAEAARRGIIKMPKPGTFTISNLGMFAVGKFLPIINPPECAILGVGAAEKRVVYAGHNAMMIREMMTLTLAADHRAADGASAAKFLNRIKELMEKFEIQQQE